MGLWHIDQVEAARVELDLTSSGHGSSTVTAIRADGVSVFNALEVVEFSAARTQVEICDHCLHVGCASCGWVVFRRLGERVLWIPAWDDMEKGEWESSMYGPPSITRGRGLPLFSARAWDQIRALRPDFPGIDALRTPDSRETARLCQWIAPARALGTFPAEPRLRRELLMVVMEGDLEAEADAVDRCLHEHFNGRCRMETLPMQSTGVLVEFWLDLPGRAGFPVAARMQDRMCLLLDGDIALVESSA